MVLFVPVIILPIRRLHISLNALICCRCQLELPSVPAPLPILNLLVEVLSTEKWNDAHLPDDHSPALVKIFLPASPKLLGLNKQ